MSGNKTGGWLASGKSAKAIAQEAEKKAAEKRDGKYMPFRFWLKKGEQCDIVILDDVFVSDDENANSAVLIKEHNLQDGQGNWGNYVSCCSGLGPCPLCNKHGEGYHLFLLTVLVLRPYTTKKGETREFSRMLLPVKLGMKDKFIDLQEANDDSIRGMRLTMKRGTGEQSVSIGEPVARKGGRLFDVVSEDKLDEWFGNDAIVDKQTRKVLKPQNADLVPFDYEELFPAPDPEEWAERYGNGPIAGSKKANQKMLDDEEEAPVTRSRRSAAVEVDEDEDEDEEPPLPTTRSRRAQTAVADNDDDDDDDIPMSHPTPSSRRRAPVDDTDDAPPATSRRRVVKDEDEEAEPPKTRARGRKF